MVDEFSFKKLATLFSAFEMHGVSIIKKYAIKNIKNYEIDHR
jgi:hypothetical protein